MNKVKLESFITEIFSSIQGEGGTVRGSCFGKRQIFIRFSGCNLSDGLYGTSGCFWCDSINAQDPQPPKAKIEEIPGSLRYNYLRNPITKDNLINIIQKLITKDLHSISFTGGEPLCQLDFILDFAEFLENNHINYPLYLETNGTLIPNKKQLNILAKYFRFCCCDIKDRSSQSSIEKTWKELVIKELDFIKVFVEMNINIFAKIIVTSQTKIGDIGWICHNLSEIEYSNGESVGLAIQPVYLIDEDLKERYLISIDHLNELFYKAAESLSSEQISLSIQAHKYLNLP